MNSIVKELYEVTKNREMLETAIRSTLETMGTELSAAFKKDIAEGYLSEDQAEAHQKEMREIFNSVMAALTSNEFVAKIEEDGAAVISEHIDDETLAQVLEFYKGETGQKILAASAKITKILNGIGIARTKETLAQKGLL